jgi:serine/threonine-protein kinase
MLPEERRAVPDHASQFDRLKTALADRYRIERELGRGGMATVYLAEDLKLDRQVAIKVLKPELAAAIGSERFLREIKLTARLEHPHILTLHDSGEAEGFLYYVMPYVEGESLRERLNREKQFAVHDAVQIARDVASALDYAHGHDVIHRDIKPENVLLGAGGAVVTDFGIARAISEAGGDKLTETGMAVGTPTYMSPEQAAGSSDLDQRSDLYSLACVVYEMLAGEPPFSGPTAEVVVRKHITAEPPSLAANRPDVPAHLGGALQRGLAKTPADRWAGVHAFVTKLDTVPHQPEGAGRKWTTPAVVGAVAIVAGGMWWLISGSNGGAGSGAGGIPSIAVLPFTDQGGGAEQYFGDGMAEDLMYALNKIEGLTVAGQTSSFSFKGTNTDLRTIGERLQVSTILSGSIRRSGDRLRVTVRLENVADGVQLWSEQYDGVLEDVFAFQDDIARRVTGQLQVALLGRGDQPLVTPTTANLEAYRQYLQGRFFLAQRGDGILRSLEYFERAVTLDSTYAKAYAGVADGYIFAGLYSLLPTQTAMPRASAAGRRALALDSSLAEAYTGLAIVSTIYEWDWAAARRLFNQALALDPNYALAHLWYGIYLHYIERKIDESVAAYERAVQLDPLSPISAGIFASGLLSAGRYADALVQAQRAVQLEPNWNSYRFLGPAYFASGRQAEAIAVLDTAAQLSGRHPWTLRSLAHALAATGDTARAVSLFDELVTRARQEYVNPTVIGVIAGYLGRLDEAFEWFERAFDEHDTDLFLLHGMTDVENKRWRMPSELVQDPRLDTLWRRMGLDQFH